MKQRYIMSHELARQRAIDAVRNAPAGYVIEIREPTRTLMQNDLMWSLLLIALKSRLFGMVIN